MAGAGGSGMASGDVMSPVRPTAKGGTRASASALRTAASPTATNPGRFTKFIAPTRQTPTLCPLPAPLRSLRSQSDIRPCRALRASWGRPVAWCLRRDTRRCIGAIREGCWPTCPCSHRLTWGTRRRVTTSPARGIHFDAMTCDVGHGRCCLGQCADHQPLARPRYAHWVARWRSLGGRLDCGRVADLASS